MKISNESLKKRILSRFKTLDTVFAIVQKREQAVQGNKAIGVKCELLDRDLRNARELYAIFTREQERDILLLQQGEQ